MKAQLYHTPSFHLRERRYVRPDYARAFRLWYDRHRLEWWLPALTQADLRLISAWEQQRCDRRLLNRAIHTSPEPLPDDTSRHLAILYLHFLNSKILPQYGEIAILCANPRDTRAFCRSIGMDLRRVHVRSHR
ncbi:MAG: hypothetical protein K2M97_00750, partial [Muribaculaceae bacterium]|nr:hypothetical protein [Muribaculaceae bacterium]